MEHSIGIAIWCSKCENMLQKQDGFTHELRCIHCNYGINIEEMSSVTNMGDKIILNVENH